MYSFNFLGIEVMIYEKGKVLFFEESQFLRCKYKDKYYNFFKFRDEEWKPFLGILLSEKNTFDKGMIINHIIEDQETEETMLLFYKQLSCQTLPDYHVQSCQICSNKSRPASRKREAWEKRALTFWAALVPFFCCYSLLFSFHHPLASLLSRTYKQREAEQRQNENKNTRETKSQWSKKGQGKGI